MSNVRQNPQPLMHAKSVVAVWRRAAVFVIAGFVDPGYAHPPADAVDLFSHPECVIAVPDAPNA